MEASIGLEKLQSPRRTSQRLGEPWTATGKSVLRQKSLRRGTGSYPGL